MAAAAKGTAAPPTTAFAPNGSWTRYHPVTNPQLRQNPSHQPQMLATSFLIEYQYWWHAECQITILEHTLGIPSCLRVNYNIRILTHCFPHTPTYASALTRPVSSARLAQLGLQSTRNFRFVLHNRCKKFISFTTSSLANCFDRPRADCTHCATQMPGPRNLLPVRTSNIA